MIKNKVIFEEQFKNDLIEAISEEKYEIVEMNQEVDGPYIQTQVRGIARTKDSGIVEFQFAAAKQRNKHHGR
jgi:hypothetical protein